MDPIEILPPEVISYVLSYLPPNDVVICSTLSTAWWETVRAICTVTWARLNLKEDVQGDINFEGNGDWYRFYRLVETPIQLSRARPHIEHTIGESVSKLLVTSTYLAYLSGTDKAVSLSLRERYPGYDGLGEEWTTDMDKMINWPQVDNSSKNELAWPKTTVLAYSEEFIIFYSQLDKYNGRQNGVGSSLKVHESIFCFDVPSRKIRWRHAPFSTNDTDFRTTEGIRPISVSPRPLSHLRFISRNSPIFTYFSDNVTSRNEMQKVIQVDMQTGSFVLGRTVPNSIPRWPLGRNGHYWQRGCVQDLYKAGPLTQPENGDWYAVVGYRVNNREQFQVEVAMTSTGRHLTMLRIPLESPRKFRPYNVKTCVRHISTDEQTKTRRDEIVIYYQTGINMAYRHQLEGRYNLCKNSKCSYCSRYPRMCPKTSAKCGIMSNETPIDMDHIELFEEFENQFIRPVTSHHVEVITNREESGGITVKLGTLETHHFETGGPRGENPILNYSRIRAQQFDPFKRLLVTVGTPEPSEKDYIPVRILRFIEDVNPYISRSPPKKQRASMFYRTDFIHRYFIVQRNSVIPKYSEPSVPEPSPALEFYGGSEEFYSLRDTGFSDAFMPTVDDGSISDMENYRNGLNSSIPNFTWPAQSASSSFIDPRQLSVTTNPTPASPLAPFQFGRAPNSGFYSPTIVSSHLHAHSHNWAFSSSSCAGAETSLPGLPDDYLDVTEDAVVVSRKLYFF